MKSVLPGTPLAGDSLSSQPVGRSIFKDVLFFSRQKGQKLHAAFIFWLHMECKRIPAEELFSIKEICEKSFNRHQAFLPSQEGTEKIWGDLERNSLPAATDTFNDSIPGCSSLPGKMLSILRHKDLVSGESPQPSFPDKKHLHKVFCKTETWDCPTKLTGN